MQENRYELATLSDALLLNRRSSALGHRLDSGWHAVSSKETRRMRAKRKAKMLRLFRLGVPATRSASKVIKPKLRVRKPTEATPDVVVVNRRPEAADIPAETAAGVPTNNPLLDKRALTEREYLGLDPLPEEKK